MSQNMSFSQMARRHSTKMQVVHELRYMLNPIPFKVPNGFFFFPEARQHDSEIHLENKQK